MKPVEPIDKVIKELKSSALFQMSLGSKELFHSNFIAWLFETYPSSIETLGMKITEDFLVEREKKNVDLVITTMEGHPIAIIENKFKDAPDRKQLIKYKKYFLKVKPCILLTLVPASFEVDDIGWEEKEYKDFVKCLDCWRLKNDKLIKAEDKIIIKLYCQMISGICEVAQEYLDSDETKGTFWFGERDLSNLEDIRFKDTYYKYEANRFAREIEISIKADAKCKEWLYDGEHEKKEIQIEVRANLYTKTPCTTTAIRCEIGGRELTLEVQIQGHQYRRLIAFKGFKIPKGKSSVELQNKLSALVEKTDKHQWLFGEGEKGVSAVNWPDALVVETAMKIGYAKYAPTAIYRYVNVAKSKDENGALQPKDLINRVKNDVKFAVSLLQSEEYTGRYKTFRQ